MHRDNKHKVLKRNLLATAMGAILLAGPLVANAAGMGKITVLSALGQPLRAELDISASKEELASLAARVAPVEAFRQANVEYASVLSTVRFTLDKHPDGKPYFKIQTDRAVNDPFIDFLVELSWSSGRLVREYAFLLDPPELKSDSAVNVAPPVAPILTPPGAEFTSKSSETTISSASPPRKMPVESSRSGKPKVSGSTSAAAAGEGNSRTVKSGDTLGKIAAESAAEGVTLDQMLVALFNSNKDAFDGGNMNRLRAGKILTIPDADKASAIAPSEARKVVVAQSADFNAYRNSLADSATKQKPVEEQTLQASGGKITPKIEEKIAATSGKDKLQVSRSEADAKSGKGKPSEEDLVARDKALKEANSRIADLEKNLTDLKKLAEMKSQSATEVQKAAQPTAAAVSPTVPAKSFETASSIGVSIPAAAPAISAVVSATDVPAVSATAAATPADEMPKPKPKKAFIPPPPEPEPSFIEENAPLVYGGGGLIALVIGFLGFRAWKRRRDAGNSQSITVSDLAASSVFGAASSQSVDTDSVPKTDFGHSTIDEIDTSKEGVDPIQEAEVYMAYGRDGQAEDILVDAMQKDPGNQAVLLKLLEIYAGRKSVPQFNTVASDLHQRSEGVGPEWEKAAALGRTVDPSNSLYGGVAPAEAAPTVTESVDQSMAATMVMDAPPVQEAPAPAAVAEEIPSAMDFDLDIGGSSTPVEASSDAAPAAMDMDFDLDLGGSEPATTEFASSGGLDIDFDTPAADAGNSVDFDIAAPSTSETVSGSTAEASGDSGLDFNFDLGDASPAIVTEPTASPLDLSSISLDLDTPIAAAADSSEVATKLELAQAYEEMGDREGARELLQEVLTEGSPAQQEAARSKLSQLG